MCYNRPQGALWLRRTLQPALGLFLWFYENPRWRSLCREAQRAPIDVGRSTSDPSGRAGSSQSRVVSSTASGSLIRCHNKAVTCRAGRPPPQCGELQSEGIRSDKPESRSGISHTHRLNIRNIKKITVSCDSDSSTTAENPV